MTSALGNTAQGTPFATGVDAYVYPQMIGTAQRAPSTQDIYAPGTRWQDNSQNPAVQYYTIGAGTWYEFMNSAFGVSSITGTANQVATSASTGAVTLSVPSSFVAPGSVAATTTITATLGNITATNGNLALSTAGNKITIATGSNASAGTSAAMSGTPGTVTVATTAVTASSLIFISRNTTGGTLGQLSVPTASITAGVSFVINSSGNETSTINWWIIN